MGNSIIKESIKKLDIIYKEIGFIFIEKSNLKYINFLYEALHSPRRTSSVYPIEWEEIKNLEINRKDRRKSFILNKYDIPNSFPIHGNVLGHSLDLNELFELYPCTDDIISIRSLKKVFLVHDLSEVEDRDHGQAQGPKTEEFKMREQKTGKKVIEYILEAFPNEKADMINIYNMLEQKDEWLYKSLKVYEEMSHIKGGISLIKLGKINYIDELEHIQKHIDKLQLRSTDYPCIHKYLESIKEELPKNNFL